MPLDDDDVREILRLIDESDVAELRVETDGLSLHVVRAGAAPPAEAPAVAADSSHDGVAILSPMIGTFYRAPAPGATPFVDVGARVEADTIVCIIEAMKLMNEIEADAAGVVKAVLVENGQPVEYGQPLLILG